MHSSLLLPIILLTSAVVSTPIAEPVAQWGGWGGQGGGGKHATSTAAVAPPAATPVADAGSATPAPAAVVGQGSNGALVVPSAAGDSTPAATPATAAAADGAGDGTGTGGASSPSPSDNSSSSGTGAGSGDGSGSGSGDGSSTGSGDGSGSGSGDGQSPQQTSPAGGSEPATTPAPSTGDGSSGSSSGGSSGKKLTITVTNKMTVPISTMHEQNTAPTSPPATGDVGSGVLPVGGKGVFYVEDGWNGNFFVAESSWTVIGEAETLFEGSYVNGAVDFDMSLAGYTVPGIFSCTGGAKIGGCSIDLYEKGTCQSGATSPDPCPNPTRDPGDATAPVAFFAPCQGQSFTYPTDAANHNEIQSQCPSLDFTVCIGSSC